MKQNPENIENAKQAALECGRLEMANAIDFYKNEFSK